MMYKFFLYTILTIIYLGLAKALSPSELGVQYLQNERSFSKLIKGEQSTAILIDTHATGFLIKTYYQKYRVISNYDTVEEFIVRTSKEFAKKNLKNIGLSIYRKSEVKEEFLPLPPGSSFLGNRQFGEWRINKAGEMKWRFNKSFKNFPKYLGWGKFRPDVNFYQQVKSHIAMNQQYLGENNEFGPEGRITRENFPSFFREERKRKIDMKSLLLQYFKENF
jgi:hypothetical protein